MANINTLGSLNKKDEHSSSSDDEGQQAFYAGGGERSGQQVLGPPGSKKNPNQLVADMFKAAREAGAQVLDRSDETERASSYRAFSGAAYSVGDGATQSPSQNVSQRVAAPEKCFRKLKMWRNGFSIDDGELRNYSDPANAEFLDCIKRGEVPRELITAARGGEVELNMEDHRTEEYVAPKRKIQTFSGEGHRLGNVAASVLQEPAPELNEAKKNAELAQSQLSLDENAPITTIQIRLADGSRVAVKVNLSHTIGALRSYICTLRPTYEASPFMLITTFPNKQLDDESLTVEQAGLANAVVVQRLIS